VQWLALTPCGKIGGSIPLKKPLSLLWTQIKFFFVFCLSVLVDFSITGTIVLKKPLKTVKISKSARKKITKWILKILAEFKLEIGIVKLAYFLCSCSHLCTSKFKPPTHQTTLQKTLTKAKRNWKKLP
jgi:hypothetical protein